MSVICVELGRIEEARQAAEKSVRAAPWRSSTVGLLAGILARLGEVDRLDALVARLREMAPLGFFWYRELSAGVSSHRGRLTATRNPGILIVAIDSTVYVIGGAPSASMAFFWPSGH